MAKPASKVPTRAVDPPPASLEEVLATAELALRPSRPPAYAAENRALVELATALAENPNDILQRAVEFARELCGGDSAGVSILEREGDRAEFRWPAVAGAWADRVGEIQPRDASPCGAVLDRDCALLMRAPERHFAAMRAVRPPAVEALMIPLHVGQRAVGTVWVVTHTDDRRFDAEDARVLGTISRFASAAYATLERFGLVHSLRAERLAALNVMDDENAARRETERLAAALRASEERQSFLVKLGDTLRPLTDPVEIQAVAARVLGEQLKVDRAYYVEVNEASGEFIVARDWHQPHAPSHARRYLLKDWSMPWLENGQTWVMKDVASDSFLADGLRAAYRDNGICAAVVVPLIKGGRLVATFVVNQNAAREWKPEETALVQETAERTWGAVERAQVEDALAKSEAQYRALFTSIDHGFCTIEVLFDERRRATDYRFLETNPAFVRQTGLENATGKTMRELAPQHEEFWFETYGQIVRTGQAMRFEHEAAALGRYYDVYAFRVGAAADNRVAILFSDISGRKRVENALRASEARHSFLVKLGDAFRLLAEPREIQAAAADLLGRHLRVNRAHYGEVKGDYLHIAHSYGDGLRPMTGTFRAEDFGQRLIEGYRAGERQVCSDAATDPLFSAGERQVLAGAHIGAYIAAPLVRGGEWVATLVVQNIEPREWMPWEIELVNEVAKRTWSALIRARAEESLRASEERTRIAVQAAEMATWEYDLRTQTVRWNERHFRIFGLQPSPGPVRPELWFEHMHPGDRPSVEERLRRTIAERTPFIAEFRAVLAGGEIRWMSGYGKVTDAGGDGTTRRISGVLFDITERKRAADTLAADLRDTRLLHDLAARLVEDDMESFHEHVLTTAVTLMQADAGSVQILDDATQELKLIAVKGLPREVTDHFQRVDIRSNTSCGMALRGGRRTAIDFRAENGEDLDGSHRLHRGAGLASALTTPLVARSGRTLGMVSTHWRTSHRPSERELRFLDLLARQAADLLEQRQAAEALRKSEERLQLALEAAQMGAFVWHVEEDRGEPDERMRMMFGLRKDTPLNLSTALASVIHPDDGPRYASEVARAMEPASGGRLLSEFRIRRSDGAERWIAVMGQVVFEGEPRRAVRLPGVAEDITERKRTEEALRRNEQLLREADQRKNDFLALLGHELRNPLAAIRGGVGLLRSDKTKPATRAATLPVVAEQVAHMERLIDDLLDVTRIVQGQLQVRLEPVILQETLYRAVEMIRGRAEAGEFDLQITLPREPLTVRADPVRLTQVFVNILTNALKYSCEARRVDITAARQNGAAVVSIRDYGPGIAPELLPRIFEPFVQAQPSLTLEGGLGLGLSVVRELVSRHGGKVEVLTGGDRIGSEFVIHLPLTATTA